MEGDPPSDNQFDTTKEISLETLEPEHWNNIPDCLVRGMKFCQKSCLGSEEAISEILHKFDRNITQQKNTNNVFHTQLGKVEDRLKNKSKDRLELYS